MVNRYKKAKVHRTKVGKAEEHPEHPCRLWQLYLLHRKWTVESGETEGRKRRMHRSAEASLTEEGGGRWRWRRPDLGFRGGRGLPRGSTLSAESGHGGRCRRAILVSLLRYANQIHLQKFLRYLQANRSTSHVAIPCTANRFE